MMPCAGSGCNAYADQGKSAFKNKEIPHSDQQEIKRLQLENKRLREEIA